MRRGGAAAAALAVAAGLVACGSQTEDLMAIDVTHGGIIGSHYKIRMTNDGRGSCGGPLEQLPSQLLLDAREVKRALRPLARRGASFLGSGPNAQHYEVRTFDGVVRWDARPGIPPAVGRATLLTLRLERRLCRRGG